MLLKTSNRDYVWAHINILYIQKFVLGCTNTCVWKSISKGMRHLNKCSFDCTDELCKAEVYGEAMLVFQPFFKTLHTLNTLPGRSKDFSRAVCQFRKTSTAHFSLYWTNVWSSKVRAKKLLFGFLWWSKLVRLIPA